jgi:multimeric flavodoxin WrbA
MRKVKIVGINGSPRKGRNTAIMVRAALDEAAKLGAETEFIEISDYKILPCLGCNHCMKENRCSQHDKDDMAKLGEKFLAADAIIFGSPVYFRNVSGQLKTLIDRTRWLRFPKRLLVGKVCGAIAHAGLRNGGQEETNQAILSYFMVQGLIPANGGAVGTMWDSQEGDAIKWKKSAAEDAVAMESSRALGKDVFRLAEKMGKSQS